MEDHSAIKRNEYGDTLNMVEPCKHYIKKNLDVLIPFILISRKGRSLETEMSGYLGLW
jgi:hypothetical protein